ncbi:hypothetical protein JCM14635_33540 [Megalodesulfovibrio paquesii]
MRDAGDVAKIEDFPDRGDVEGKEFAIEGKGQMLFGCANAHEASQMTILISVPEGLPAVTGQPRPAKPDGAACGRRGPWRAPDKPARAGDGRGQ